MTCLGFTVYVMEILGVGMAMCAYCNYLCFSEPIQKKLPSATRVTLKSCVQPCPS